MAYNAFIHNVMSLDYQPPKTFPPTMAGDPGFVCRDLYITTTEGSVRLSLFATQADALELVTPKPDLKLVPPLPAPSQAEAA
mgnify:CR=1 FL=1